MRGECIGRLVEAGIAYADAVALRRIAMTLHRWHELECGDGNSFQSWCLVRGWKENGEFRYSDHGQPFLECHAHNSSKPAYNRVPDREKGARKRLGRLLSAYPGFQAYVQGDPRGASLYVLRPGDVKAGEDVSSVYSRGIAVYK